MSALRPFRLHFVSRSASSPYAEEVPFAIDILAASERQANLIGNRSHQRESVLGGWYVRCEELYPEPHGEVRWR